MSVGCFQYNITQYYQNYIILPILHDDANPAWVLQVSMAIHGFDIAVGMSPEACSKRVHCHSCCALSQDKINTIVRQGAGLLSVYFGEAQKALTTYLKKHLQFLKCFSKKRSSAQQESDGDAWLG